MVGIENKFNHIFVTRIPSFIEGESNNMSTGKSYFPLDKSKTTRSFRVKLSI